jgi:hypothetical protein
MKKFLIGFISGSILFSGIAFADSSNSVSFYKKVNVIFNGSKENNPQGLLVSAGQRYLPEDFVVKTLNYTVSYDNQLQNMYVNKKTNANEIYLSDTPIKEKSSSRIIVPKNVTFDNIDAYYDKKETETDKEKAGKSNNNIGDSFFPKKWAQTYYAIYNIDEQPVNRLLGTVVMDDKKTDQDVEVTVQIRDEKHSGKVIYQSSLKKGKTKETSNLQQKLDIDITNVKEIRIEVQVASQSTSKDHATVTLSDLRYSSNGK